MARGRGTRIVIAASFCIFAGACRTKDTAKSGGYGNGEAVPISTSANNTLANLRERPASPLTPGSAAGFRTASRGLVPHFAGRTDKSSAHLVLPSTASLPVRLEDAATGMAIEFSLKDARDSLAQAADGYLIYPGAHASGATLLHRALPEGTEDFLTFDTRPQSAHISYQLTLGAGVAGLRLVERTLEMLDGGGAPRLRVAPPFLVGADGERTEATLALEGCASDTNPAAPWGRRVTPPGSRICTVRIAWPNDSVQFPAVLDPRWTTTGSMGTPRQEHSAIVLATGTVLVAGGRPDTGTAAVATAELYDRMTGTWSPTGSMAGARRLHTATQLNPSSNSTTSSKVLVAGGINGAASVNTAQLYSPSAGTWVPAGTMNAARHGHTATLLADGKVLVAGGLNGTATLQSAAIYNPSSGAGTWSATTGPLPPTGQKLHTATLIQTSNQQLNNKVLLVGGNNGTSTLAAVYLFDPAQSAFSTLASLPGPREQHTAVRLANGKILIAGGRNGSSVLSTTAVFDPSVGPGSWSPADTLQSARVGHSMTVLPSNIVANGQVLVAGGSNGNNAVTSAELFSTSSLWANTTAMPGPVQGHTATLLANGAVLLAGGFDGTNVLSAATIYDASNGLGCTSNGQCTTGACVNGVCCDTACNGGCGACNLSGHVGTCWSVAAGPTCRPTSGPCDVAETCNGTSPSCPADSFMPSTTVCRASTGACDAAESCTGASAGCPADVFLPATTTCRAVAGTCDAEEKCTGTSAACPADAVLPATTVCRLAASQCDLAETCDGSSAACPVDLIKGDLTVCNDGNACTQLDRCQDGVCVGENPVSCTALDACHEVGTCDQSSGACSNPPKAGAVCVTDTVVVKCPPGSQLPACVTSVTEAVATSTASQRSDVISDLQKWAAVPGFAAAYANTALASFNPSGPMDRLLIRLAILGQMKTADGTQVLKQIVHMPLPTTGRCVSEESGGCDDFAERQYVSAAQLKAMDGLAFLNSSEGDTELLTAVGNSANFPLQATAVSAFLSLHGRTAATKASLAAMLPADRQFLVDRFVKDDTTPESIYGPALIDFYNNHPSFVPPFP